MNDKEYIVLLEEPLIRADFNRMTFGDFARVMAEPNYVYIVMEKCILEDVNQIPFDYAPAIIQAFMREYAQLLKDMTTVHELMGSQ